MVQLVGSGVEPGIELTKKPFLIVTGSGSGSFCTNYIRKTHRLYHHEFIEEAMFMSGVAYEANQIDKAMSAKADYKRKIVILDITWLYRAGASMQCGTTVLI